MGGSSKAPKAPDYSSLATQQASIDQAAAERALQANRISQTTPFASTSWTQGPGGQWSQNVSLNPSQQSQYDTWTSAATNALRGYNANPIDYSNVPGMYSPIDYNAHLGSLPAAVDYGAQLGPMPQVGGYNQQVIDTINALNAPGLQRQRDAEQARMAAMGVGAGTGMAYQQGQQALSDAENTARLNAIMQGIQQGNTEYGQALQGRAQRAGELGQTFGQQVQSRQLGEQELQSQLEQQMALHKQSISDITSERAANLAQLQGLMGLGEQFKSDIVMPAYAAYGGSAGANQLGAAQSQYQANLDKANAANADQNAKLGTAATIAGAAIM